MQLPFLLVSCFTVVDQKQPKKELSMPKFYFWNVQHGAAAYVQADNGRAIVVDLGNGSLSTSAPFSPIEVLRARGALDELHLLVITHPHDDHLADLPSLRGVPVRRVEAPLSIPKELLPKDNDVLIDEYLRLTTAHAYQPAFTLGQRLKEDWDGMKVRVFRPACKSANINNYSLVVAFEYEGSWLMVSGDNEASSWEALLQDQAFVSVLSSIDIFVAPHHGRESGFYAPLFEKLKPKLTIISDGPETDTTAVSRYSSVTRGMKVRYKNGGAEKRYCVTTRCDGTVMVEFHDFLSPTVTVEKGANER